MMKIFPFCFLKTAASGRKQQSAAQSSSTGTNLHRAVKKRARLKDVTKPNVSQVRGPNLGYNLCLPVRGGGMRKLMKIP